MTPKPLLQLKSVLIIYRHTKSINTNYIVYIKYPRYQIYNFYGALHLFLVDKGGGSHHDSIIIVSLITLSVLIHLQRNKHRWICIENADPTMCKYVKIE